MALTRHTLRGGLGGRGVGRGNVVVQEGHLLSKDRLAPSTQREEESAGSGLPSGLSSPVPRAYPRVSFRTLPKS